MEGVGPCGHVLGSDSLYQSLFHLPLLLDIYVKEMKAELSYQRSIRLLVTVIQSDIQSCTGEQPEKIAGGLACVDLKHSCHVRFSSHSQIVIVKLEIVLHLKCLLGDLSVTLPVSGDNEQD